MLSELRKYNVGLTMAHQYLTQLEPEVRDAVIGNAGTLISFRLGGRDAPMIAREFLPTFTAEDLVGLSNYHIYLKLMIDGAPSKPFSARTLSVADWKNFVANAGCHCRQASQAATADGPE